MPNFIGSAIFRSAMHAPVEQLAYVAVLGAADSDRGCLHTGAMLLTMGIIAVFVYGRLGVGVAVITAAGVVTLFT